MLQIDILDKAKDTVSRYSEIGINPTFTHAYFYSIEAGNELINFADVIWDYDIEPIIENCKRFNIKEFTISSHMANLLYIVSEFQKRGFDLTGIIEVNSRVGDWKNPKEKERIPALKIGKRTKCLNCKFCQFTDDGETMAYKCTAKSEKGKNIYWHMHTGHFCDGKFIKEDEEDIKARMQRHLKIPYWCPEKLSK